MKGTAYIDPVRSGLDHQFRFGHYSFMLCVKALFRLQRFQTGCHINKRRCVYRAGLYRKAVPVIIDHGKGFLLKPLLPVHETAISDTVFQAPLPL